MKRLLVLLIILLACPAYAQQCSEDTQIARLTTDKLGGGVPVADGGETCSGNALTGSNESFESGTGAFCTTGWTETDAAGAIDTYSTTAYFCGTHGMAVTYDNDTGTGVYAVVNLGGVDNNIYWRGYLKIPARSAYENIGLVWFGQGTDDYHAALSFVMEDVDADQWKICIDNAGLTCGGYYFDVTAPALLRAEIHAVGAGGTSTMKLWKCSNGANGCVGGTWDAVASTQGAGYYEISQASDSYNIQYISINAGESNSTASTTVIFDDIVIDVDGADYIGARTCD